MLSITIEKEDFEVNCLYKTRWDSYPGIGKGKQILFIKKNLPNFLHTFSVGATWTFNKYNNNIEK
jgi:hypothetical protein